MFVAAYFDTEIRVIVYEGAVQLGACLSHHGDYGLQLVVGLWVQAAFRVDKRRVDATAAEHE
jgi:hypothetical protein